MSRILVTGCCGFIGSHVCEQLLKRGDTVLGIDISENSEILKILYNYPKFLFFRENILRTKQISIWKPDIICHLAGIAGVRPSIENPILYVQYNIEMFIHILEEAHKNNVKNIVYASSSSVYGLNKKIPFSENDVINSCNSPYACSKLSMEIFAKTYTQLYPQLSLIGLRFFTVYGPRGRKDMAPYKFLTSIMDEKVFQKYGNGETSRDYTYIDDIVDGIISALDNKKGVKYEIYNLGNSNPITLNNFISTCEKVVGKKALYEEIPHQLGDVPITYADISKASRDLDYNPKINLEEGLQKTFNYLKNIISTNNKCI